MDGGILDQTMRELEVEVDPSNIPNHVEVDVTPLKIGDSHSRQRYQAARRRRGCSASWMRRSASCLRRERWSRRWRPPKARRQVAAEPEVIGKKKEEGEEEAEEK